MASELPMSLGGSFRFVFEVKRSESNHGGYHD